MLKDGPTKKGSTKSRMVDSYSTKLQYTEIY